MSGFSTRPHSLHEVSRRAAAGEQGFDAAVREFLDVFYAHSGGRTAAIAECPASLSPANLGNVKDAYLSATAEHLARSHGIPVPQWTDLHGWNVRRPFFAGGNGVHEGVADRAESDCFPAADAVHQQRRAGPAAASARCPGQEACIIDPIGLIRRRGRTVLPIIGLPPGASTMRAAGRPAG